MLSDVHRAPHDTTTHVHLCKTWHETTKKPEARRGPSQAAGRPQWTRCNRSTKRQRLAPTSVTYRFSTFGRSPSKHGSPQKHLPSKHLTSLHPAASGCSDSSQNAHSAAAPSKRALHAAHRLAMRRRPLRSPRLLPKTCQTWFVPLEGGGKAPLLRNVTSTPLNYTEQPSYQTGSGVFGRPTSRCLDPPESVPCGGREARSRPNDSQSLDPPCKGGLCAGSQRLSARRACLTPPVLCLPVTHCVCVWCVGQRARHTETVRASAAASQRARAAEAVPRYDRPRWRRGRAGRPGHSNKERCMCVRRGARAPRPYHAARLRRVPAAAQPGAARATAGRPPPRRARARRPWSLAWPASQHS